MTGNPKPINKALGINIAYPELGLTTDVPSDKAIDHVKCSNSNVQTNNQEKASFTSVNVPADTVSAKNYASAVTNSPVAMGKNNPTNGVTPCNMLGKNLELTSPLVSPLMDLNSLENSVPSCDVLGKNLKLTSPLVSPLMGLNSPENSAVTGVNDAELTPCDASMPLEDISKNPIVGSKQNNTALNSVPSLNPVNNNLDHSSDVNICNSDCEMNVHGDPYLDVSLSGALEKLSVTELSVIDTLISLHMITENSTDYVHTDHNYYMMYCSNNMQEPLVTERTENLVTSACIFSTDDLQGSASRLNDCEIDNSVHDILLSTEYQITEMDNNQSMPETNSSSEGTNHIYSPKAIVLGINTLHLTSSSEFEGFTKEDLEILLTKCANQQCVIGSNENEYDTEDDHVSVKSVMGTNKTPLCEMGLNIDNTDTGMMGVNSTPPTADNTCPNNDNAEHCNIDNCASSLSSDFDGFTQEDLKSLPSMANLDSDTNSSPASLYSSEESESEHYDYETDIFSSDDTILYQVPTPTTETYVKKSSATAPIPLVEEMWRTEALTRKYSVPLNKLNKHEIYDLSHPPPDWDSIDPYSGLEDHSDDENNNPKKN